MIARPLLAGTFALLIGIQVVRSATVRSLAEAEPASAARAWPSHPDVQLSLGLTGIATAAREGRRVSPALLKSIYAVSAKAPLSPEPFLVRGVRAQLAGDDEAAERAFVQARWRDGRSLPARYFLADHYFRERETAKGLREIAALGRLAPQGVATLAPYVARYASDPENREELRALFRRDPLLEESALTILAADPRSADLVVSLSDPRRRNSDSAWLPRLLSSLVEDRQYSKARQIWSAVSGARLKPGDLIYDPRFTRPTEPPPFNWSLTSSTVGMADRQRGGGLRVIYYGQEDGALASQLLILPPGTYRLATRAGNASQARLLSWSLVCAPTNQAIASIPLPAAVRSGWTFTIPPSCPAQRLELRGTSDDTAHQVDIVVQDVNLTSERSDG